MPPPAHLAAHFVSDRSAARRNTTTAASIQSSLHEHCNNASHDSRNGAHASAAGAAAGALLGWSRRRVSRRAPLASLQGDSIHGRGLTILVAVPTPLCSGAVLDHQQACRRAVGNGGRGGWAVLGWWGRQLAGLAGSSVGLVVTLAAVLDWRQQQGVTARAEAPFAAGLDCHWQSHPNSPAHASSAPWPKEGSRKAEYAS